MVASCMPLQNLTSKHETRAVELNLGKHQFCIASDILITNCLLHSLAVLSNN